MLFVIALLVVACNRFLGVDDPTPRHAAPDRGPSPTEAGSLICPSDQASCGDRCLTLMGDDAANCGACGHDCLGAPCRGGVCGVQVLHRGLDLVRALVAAKGEAFYTALVDNSGVFIARAGRQDVPCEGNDFRCRIPDVPEDFFIPGTGLPQALAREGDGLYVGFRGEGLARYGDDGRWRAVGQAPALEVDAGPDVVAFSGLFARGESVFATVSASRWVLRYGTAGGTPQARGVCRGCVPSSWGNLVGDAEGKWLFAAVWQTTGSVSPGVHRVPQHGNDPCDADACLVLRQPAVRGLAIQGSSLYVATAASYSSSTLDIQRHPVEMTCADPPCGETVVQGVRFGSLPFPMVVDDRYLYWVDGPALASYVVRRLPLGERCPDPQVEASPCGEVVLGPHPTLAALAVDATALYAVVGVQGGEQEVVRWTK